MFWFFGGKLFAPLGFVTEVGDGTDLNSRGRICMSYSMIRKMRDGSLLEVMIVVTPAAVAISAAMSFVSIPPVPRLDPKVVVLTVMKGILGKENMHGRQYANPPSEWLGWNQQLQLALRLGFCEGSKCKDHRRP